MVPGQKYHNLICARIFTSNDAEIIQQLGHLATITQGRRHPSPPLHLWLSEEIFLALGSNELPVQNKVKNLFYLGKFY